MEAIGVIAAIIVLLLVGFVLGESYRIGALQKILDRPAAAAALIAALPALIMR
jgi:hypothetical protein